jgi:hypothetical protein
MHDVEEVAAFGGNLVLQRSSRSQAHQPLVIE